MPVLVLVLVLLVLLVLLPLLLFMIAMMLDWRDTDKLTVASKTFNSDDWQTFISEHFWRYCSVLSEKTSKLSEKCLTLSRAHQQVAVV